MKFFILFFLFPAFGEKTSDVVIVNTNQTVNANKTVNENKAQSVTATALVPSKAKKLRNAREDAEVKTESLILEQVEKERLKNEQNILGKVLSPSEGVQEAVSEVPAVPHQPLWSWGKDRAYISLGAGAVQFPGVSNINSLALPALFVSVGGMAKKYFLIDFSLYYSKHYLDPEQHSNIRELIHQPSAGMSIRVSPFQGKVRPYGGVSGAYIGRRVDPVDKNTGEALETHHGVHVLKDVARKNWMQSFDGGISTGVDVILGPHLGLNVDFRYHWNFYTESTALFYYYTDQKLLDSADSVLFSVNLRYYF